MNLAEGTNEPLLGSCQQFVQLGEAYERGNASEHELYTAIDRIAERFAHSMVFVLSGVSDEEEPGDRADLVDDPRDTYHYVTLSGSDHGFPYVTAWTSLTAMAAWVPKGCRYVIMHGVDLANQLFYELQNGEEPIGLIIDNATPHAFVFDPTSIEQLHTICQASGAPSAREGLRSASRAPSASGVPPANGSGESDYHHATAPDSTLVADDFFGAPAPIPWYPPADLGEQYVWSRASEVWPHAPEDYFYSTFVLQRDGVPILALPTYTSLLITTRGDLLAARALPRGAVGIWCVRPESLTPLGAVEQLIRSAQPDNGGVVGLPRSPDVLINPLLPPGIHSAALPSHMGDLDPVAFLLECERAGNSYPPEAESHHTIFEVNPAAGTIGIFSQDWFNIEGERDRSWEWQTRAMRGRDDGAMHVDGLRISPVVLAENCRNLR